MKKLLITTMAAVSVGLCAKADDTGFISGTSFETLNETDYLAPNGGQTLCKWYNAAGIELSDDDSLDPELGSRYWMTEATDAQLVVSNLSMFAGGYLPNADRPQQWSGGDNTKALYIDTDKPLMRYVHPSTDGNTAVGADLNQDIFIDSVVQFTATDVAAEPESGDKLRVWLYTSPENLDGTVFGEEEAVTRLVVTAGYYKPNDSTTHKTNYLTNVSISPDSWHRLTIKTFVVGGYTKFNIYVDGEIVKVGDLQDFDSLFKVDGQDTLQCVAFDGKGAVDDIVFTTTAPGFAQEDDDEEEIYSLTLNFDSNVEIYQFQIGGVTVENVASGSSYTIPVDVQMYLNVLPANGYELTFEGASFNPDGFGGYECTITPTAVGAGTITIKAVLSGSGDKPTIGGTAYDGDDLVAEAKSGAQITVPSDVWSVEGNVLKDAKGDAFATFAAYYVLTKDGTTVTVALDQKAAAPFAEATDLTEGQEVFELGEEEDGDAFVGVRVKTFPGLWYGLGTAAELGTWSEPAKWAEGGDGTVIQLKADRDPNAKAGFFKVRVVDVKPQQENSGN